MIHLYCLNHYLHKQHNNTTKFTILIVYHQRNFSLYVGYCVFPLTLSAIGCYLVGLFISKVSSDYFYHRLHHLYYNHYRHLHIYHHYYRNHHPTHIHTSSSSLIFIHHHYLSSALLFIYRYKIVQMMIVKAIFVVIGFVWSTRASVVFMGQVIKEERRALAVFPVFFFYTFIGWMILLQ